MTFIHFNQRLTPLILGVLALFCTASIHTSPIDLEERAQDFVLDTQQINIPGYPHAFNPSIIRWKGSLLLSFRDIPNPSFSFISHIGLVWLNEDFSLASAPQLLDTQAEDSFITSLIPPRSEDGRLVLIGDRLFLVYSDNKNLTISKGGFRVYLGELDYIDGKFSLHHVECLTDFEGETQQKREKNWTPFDYNGTLLLAYSLLPHLIFRPLLGTSSCETFSVSESEISWKWGELRGGTPAVRVGDRYLSFFHSSTEMTSVHSNGKNISHYFMGAYTFSSEPPFTIDSISPEPIVGRKFYSGAQYKPFWKPVSVVFPGGYVQDDHYIWIAYGRQDHEVWITKLDKQGLLQSLVPVQEKSLEATVQVPLP